MRKAATPTTHPPERARHGKVKKPTSITTIKEREEALEWIDLELDKLDRNIRITSRAIFSPKKWTTAISGILWSKQVKQKTSDHVCNSPFLSKLEGSARSDQNLPGNPAEPRHEHGERGAGRVRGNLQSPQRRGQRSPSRG